MENLDRSQGGRLPDALAISSASSPDEMTEALRHSVTFCTIRSHVRSFVLPVSALFVIAYMMFIAGNMAVPLLAQELGGGATSTGGAVLLAIVAAIAFSTILAVVAGLTLASSVSFAHDFYGGVWKRGRAEEAREVKVARVAALFIGASAILLAIAVRNLNIAFLISLAFAVAASANAPAVVFSLFWRRFNTIGAVAGIYAGLACSIGLVLVSPTVIGPTGLVLHGFAPFFPLANPGIVSIPVGFAAAWLGTLLTSEPSAARGFDELELRALTGVRYTAHGRKKPSMERPARPNLHTSGGVTWQRTSLQSDTTRSNGKLTKAILTY